MMRRKEIANEIERRQKNFEHLEWVASTKLTKSHRTMLEKEMEAELLAIAKLTLEFQQKEGHDERRDTGSPTSKPRSGKGVRDDDHPGGSLPG